MTAAFANGLAGVLDSVLFVLQIVVIASVVISWVNADPGNPIVRAIRAVTEPLYAIFRPITRKIPGPFDWSPIFVLLLIIFLQRSVVFYLTQYARSANI
jgi:YggT family protein